MVFRQHDELVAPGPPHFGFCRHETIQALVDFLLRPDQFARPFSRFGLMRRIGRIIGMVGGHQRQGIDRPLALVLFFHHHVQSLFKDLRGLGAVVWCGGAVVAQMLELQTNHAGLAGSPDEEFEQRWLVCLRVTDRHTQNDPWIASKWRRIRSCAIHAEDDVIDLNDTRRRRAFLHRGHQNLAGHAGIHTYMIHPTFHASGSQVDILFPRIFLCSLGIDGRSSLCQIRRSDLAQHRNGKCGDQQQTRQFHDQGRSAAEVIWKHGRGMIVDEHGIGLQESNQKR